MHTTLKNNLTDSKLNKSQIILQNQIMYHFSKTMCWKQKKEKEHCELLKFDSTTAMSYNIHFAINLWFEIDLVSLISENENRVGFSVTVLLFSINYLTSKFTIVRKYFKLTNNKCNKGLQGDMSDTKTN